MMPVTAPMAKLIRNSVPKKRVSRSPDLVPAPVGQHLHDRHQEGQSDGERDKQEVVRDRDTELPAVQQHLHVRQRSPPGRTGTSSIRLVRELPDLLMWPRARAASLGRSGTLTWGGTVMSDLIVIG